MKLISSPTVVKRCQPFSLTFQVSDPDKNLREVQVDWSGKGTNVTGHLVGDGQIITVSSPVGTNTACPSELTNKSDTTLLTWTATAYDTLGAKSKMAKNGVYVGRVPVQAVNNKSGGSKTNSCSSKSGGKSCTHVGDPVSTITGSQIIDLKLLKLNGVLPVSFSLSYDSAILDGNGIVGKAWSSNLSNTRLEQTPENDVIIHWSEIQYNTFLLQFEILKINV